MKPAIIVFFTLVTLVLSTSKTLSQNCYCDVSNSCDDHCCCDSDCSSSIVTLWNNYNLCANDGFSIPFCSAYYSQPLHIHDLSQGLRLIYTVIKRLFCISRVNFATPADSYQTTSTNEQLPSTSDTTVSAVNPKVLDLTSINTYPALPMKNSLGQCVQTKARDMNSVQSQSCLVYVSSTASITSVNLLNPSSFCTANSLDPTQLKAFDLSSTSLTSSTTVSALTTSFTCTASGSTNQCNVIKQIKLFFIKGSTTTVDYTSSYIVIGPAYVNSPSYVTIKYSYEFMSKALDFAYGSSKGYQIGTPLNLLLQTTSGSTTTYYKVFNPLNLAYRQLDGTCRTSSSDSTGPNNLINLQFGVNSVHSCMGTTSIIAANLQAIFTHVGSMGISSTNLNDYVSLSVPSTINTNQNLQLIFYYTPIGTNLNPQYQIVQVQLNPLSNTNTNIPTSLYVQYQSISTSVFMNVPSPPTIDASLPDDFLYPFYVA